MTDIQGAHVTDGPVLSGVNKRLRALRKKLNRTIYMEELLSQGKTLNKEQAEALRLKSSLMGAISELEKLIQPLSVSVAEEIHNTETFWRKESESEKNSMVEDILELLYVGILFDIQSPTDCRTMMLIRERERNRCLLYDHVSDDAVDILCMKDLDQISALGRMILSRPLNSSLPHQNALRQCLEQARLWLDMSDQPIGSHPSVTYAGLRQKLNKIMSSEYFTKAPEMKDPLEFRPCSFHEPTIQHTVIPINVPDQVECPQVQYEQQHKEEAETVKTEGIENSNDLSTALDEIYPVDVGGNSSEFHVQTEPVTVQQSEIEKGLEYHAGTSSQNYRGGRRGYSNGRRGRGNNRGGGTYFNGRNQYYEQGEGYYPKNNYYRGRGGRGSGSSHNYQVGDGGYLVAN